MPIFRVFFVMGVGGRVIEQLFHVLPFYRTGPTRVQGSCPTPQQCCAETFYKAGLRTGGRQKVREMVAHTEYRNAYVFLPHGEGGRLFQHLFQTEGAIGGV